MVNIGKNGWNLHGCLMNLFYKYAEKIEESMAMFVGGFIRFQGSSTHMSHGKGRGDTSCLEVLEVCH